MRSISSKNLPTFISGPGSPILAATRRLSSPAKRTYVMGISETIIVFCAGPGSPRYSLGGVAVKSAEMRKVWPSIGDGVDVCL